MEGKLKRFLIGLFVTLFGANSSAQVNQDAWKEDPAETIVGIHLISDYGSEHTILSTEISREIIDKELEKLDWNNNFYQFAVVVSPGVSMEVGGSLNGIDGLSAMYRDRNNRVDAVIKRPPETVKQMQEILESFISENGNWQQLYDFEFTNY